MNEDGGDKPFGCRIRSEPDGDRNPGERPLQAVRLASCLSAQSPKNEHLSGRRSAYQEPEDGNLDLFQQLTHWIGLIVGNPRLPRSLLMEG
jgi:hypothetical protein